MSKPEDRYINLTIKTLPSGKQVYKSSIPKKIESTQSDLTFVANEEDRMDIIANNIYGSSIDWWRIAAINRKVNGSLHFKPGQTVIIPQA